jgi:hypothetical protein
MGCFYVPKLILETHTDTLLVSREGDILFRHWLFSIWSSILQILFNNSLNTLLIFQQILLAPLSKLILCLVTSHHLQSYFPCPGG